MAGLSFTIEYREMLVLLRRAREVAGLTQAQVADACGRSQAIWLREGRSG